MNASTILLLFMVVKTLLSNSYVYFTYERWPNARINPPEASAQHVRWQKTANLMMRGSLARVGLNELLCRPRSQTSRGALRHKLSQALNDKPEAFSQT